MIERDSVKFKDLRKALEEAGFKVDKMDFKDPREESPDEATQDEDSVKLTVLSDDAAELKAAFNEAKGKVRLLMILSGG